MASNTTTTVVRPRQAWKAATILISVWLACPGTGRAQRGADLSDIVFEPVLLSTVEARASDFGDTSAGETDALLDYVDDLREAIEPLERRRSRDPELIELLAQLGLTYQRLDRHTEAIETFDTAIELTVDNGGKRNLEQIPLHEQKIPSYLALDDFAAIDDTEERIYELKAASYAPASRQMYYATINLADWNTAAYFLENYRAGNGRGFGRLRTVLRRPSRSIALPNGDSEPDSGEETRLADTGGLAAIFSGQIRGVNKLDIIDPRLRRIDRLYVEFQNAVAETGSAEIDVSIDIAKRIARLAHLTKQEMDYERDNYSYEPDYDGSLAQAMRTSPERMDESYDTGRQALEYVLSLIRSVDDLPPEAAAAALLDLGDWHLAYGRAQAARVAYGEARQALLDAGFTSANIDRALASPMPLQIPVFATHLYSRASAGLDNNAGLEYEGYVDVAFTIDEIGNGTDLEFIGDSGGDTERIEQMLEIRFQSIKFRPVLQEGEMRPSGRIELRYNYSY